MPKQSEPGSGAIYIHDSSQGCRLQIRGTLDARLAPELLQVWETTRSIGPAILIDLKSAGPITAEGEKALEYLRASGARIHFHKPPSSRTLTCYLPLWMTAFLCAMFPGHRS
ncbi:MAG: hypothetical protein H7039_00980 [Bryobacteraceae bacterium]|nr:hypothetical protein [Bryobacteraceae bacterium]